MVVVLVGFRLGPRYAKERLSGDRLEDEAAETPNVEGFIDGSGNN